MADRQDSRPKSCWASSIAKNETLEHVYTARAIADAMFVLTARGFLDELNTGSAMRLLERIDTELAPVQKTLESELAGEETIHV